MELLLASLRSAEDRQSQSSIYLFLDNCFSRVVKTPVHYQDLVRSMFGERQTHRPLALLAAVVIEQWPYAFSREDRVTRKSIAKWIVCFFSCLIRDDLMAISLDNFQQAIYATSESDESRIILQKAFKHHTGNLTAGALDLHDHESSQQNPANADSGTAIFEPSIDQVWKMRMESQQSRQARSRRELEDVEVAVSEGHLSDMMLCLCSPQEEMRLRAMNDISVLMHKMLVSPIPHNDFATDFR